VLPLSALFTVDSFPFLIFLITNCPCRSFRSKCPCLRKPCRSSALNRWRHPDWTWCHSGRSSWNSRFQGGNNNGYFATLKPWSQFFFARSFVSSKLGWYWQNNLRTSYVIVIPNEIICSQTFFYLTHTFIENDRKKFCENRPRIWICKTFNQVLDRIIWVGVPYQKWSALSNHCLIDYSKLVARNFVSSSHLKELKTLTSSETILLLLNPIISSHQFFTNLFSLTFPSYN
jgi:hypothetical protein